MQDVCNGLGTVDERLAQMDDLEGTLKRIMDEKGGEDKFRRWVKRRERSGKLDRWHATMHQDRDIIDEGISKLDGKQEAAEWLERLDKLEAKVPDDIAVPTELYGEYEAVYREILDSKGGRDAFMVWAGVEMRDAVTTEWTSAQAAKAAEQIDRKKSSAP